MVVLKLEKIIKSLFKFPHIITFTIISFLMFLALVISITLEIYDYNYASSIFANIFAGLLTGLVILTITGVKQSNVSKLKMKKIHLEKLHKNIMEYIDLYDKLLRLKSSNFDSAVNFDFIYDVASHANWVNDYILQSSYNETIPFDFREYCKNELEYDAYGKIDVFVKLHDDVLYLDIYKIDKNETLNCFKDIDKELRGLMNKTYNAIKETEITLERLERMII